MAVTRIPLNPDSKAFRYNIALGGRAFIFAFRYAARHDSWYLSIYQRDETPIRTGVRLVVNFPLYLFENDPLLPSGVFVVIRTDDAGNTEASIDDFNGRVRLLRLTDDDIPEPADSTIPLVVEATP